MPDCSFEELIPIFSARYSGDHLWLRPAMKRYGIWRLVHRSHPENSRPMTRSPRNHRITIIYQILHLMYCRTYVNLYDAVRSVIPCDKLHKHQFSFNNDGQQRASFGWEREFQYGGNFSVSWDRNFPEINFGFTSQFSRTHGQGRIQDLKLGVAQMDWKILKKRRGGYWTNILKMRLL